MKPPQRVNILLVDDRPENLLALEAVLADLGQNLVKARGGEEALRHLLRQDFAVILLDVYMPGMDGFETAAMIRQRKRSEHTPIIFITALGAEHADVVRGYERGAVDYIFTPIVPEILRSKVTVFVELFKKAEEITRQAEQLAATNRELGREIAERKQAEEEIHTLSAELQRRAAQEVEARYQRFLAETSAVLAASLDYETTLRNVARLAVPALADVSILTLVEGDRVIRRRVAHAEGPREGRVQDLERTHLAVVPPRILEVLHTGRPEIVAEITDAWLETCVGDTECLDILRPRQLRSAMLVPLVAQGRPLGTLCLLSARSGREYGAADAALAENLASRAALAIENARMYEYEHGIARTLQRSLLPERLPQIPGLALASRYVLPGTGSEVGGDWYDVIAFPDGRLGLVMGDVAGRGVRSASVMGQLRNALRAYALDGHSPAAVARRLNALALNLDPPEMATLVYLVVDPMTWAVRYTNAGHPPPLVVASSGTARYLEAGRCGPVGVARDAEYAEMEARLELNAILILYTDGLIDRQGPLDEVLARLAQVVVGAPPDPERLCDHVLAEFLDGKPARDDIALLALRASPLIDQLLRLRLPAAPASLATLRHTLRRWLGEAGAEPDETFDILLASGEAAANAIAHAYTAGDAVFEVEAALVESDAIITVRDFGQWRPRRETGRGYGLQLMKRLMDHADVTSGPQGTTVLLRRRLQARAAR